MKKLLLLLLTTFTFSCCNKDDKNQQEQLPAATQTGANTAGCLVNGEIFLPKGSSLGGPILSCFYQQDADGYHLGLSISNKSSEIIKTIRFATNPSELMENTTYNLIAMTNNGSSYTSNFGVYTIYNDVSSDNIYTTTSTTSGELKITRLNTEIRIISGTFWYDAINPRGEVVEVREGRFDMHFVN